MHRTAPSGYKYTSHFMYWEHRIRWAFNKLIEFCFLAFSQFLVKHLSHSFSYDFNTLYSYLSRYLSLRIYHKLFCALEKSRGTNETSFQQTIQLLNTSPIVTNIRVLFKEWEHSTTFIASSITPSLLIPDILCGKFLLSSHGITLNDVLIKCWLFLSHTFKTRTQSLAVRLSSVNEMIIKNNFYVKWKVKKLFDTKIVDRN